MSTPPLHPSHTHTHTHTGTHTTEQRNRITGIENCFKHKVKNSFNEPVKVAKGRRITHTPTRSHTYICVGTYTG